jgi:hypothetical protein
MKTTAVLAITAIMKTLQFSGHELCLHYRFLTLLARKRMVDLTGFICSAVFYDGRFVRRSNKKEKWASRTYTFRIRQFPVKALSRKEKSLNAAHVLFPFLYNKKKMENTQRLLNTEKDQI